MSIMAALPLLGSIGSSIAGWFGAQEQNKTQMEMAQRNIDLQREFATTGIQWRVRDAKKAGVHPLYALGANTTSFSPVSVGTVNEMAPFANMGQDLSRAAAAMAGPSARANAVGAVSSAMELKAGQLRLENMELQNQALRAKLATINQPGTPPGIEFAVPENPKPEQRPPLMLENERLDTSPGTSPIKSYSDQYGDENVMIQQVLGNLMLGRDYIAHMLNNPTYTRFARELMRRLVPARFGVGQLPIDTHGRY